MELTGTAKRFKDEVIRRLDEVFDGQEDALHEAAVIFADTIERGGIIRAFGSGHSHANALEICGRAGGYIQTKVVREPAWGIYEMIDGVGDQFWLKLDLRPEDCLVVISNSGRNPLPVELAMHAQEAGVKVIAVTAVDISSASTSRSKSGKQQVLLRRRGARGRGPGHKRGRHLALHGLPAPGLRRHGVHRHPARARGAAAALHERQR